MKTVKIDEAMNGFMKAHGRIKDLEEIKKSYEEKIRTYLSKRDIKEFESPCGILAKIMKGSNSSFKKEIAAKLLSAVDLKKVIKVTPYTWIKVSKIKK